MRKRSVLLGLFFVMQITFVLSGQAALQTVSLTTWDLPYAEAFPAGIALGADGAVYVVAA